MKKLIISLCILFAIPVWASEPVNTETYQNQFIQAVYVPLKPPITLEIASSCVLYGKWYQDKLDEKWGNAGQIEATSEKPYVGGIVLTREGKYGHLAVILDIRDNTLFLTEANYIPGQISTRSLSLDSPVIRGYK